MDYDWKVTQLRCYPEAEGKSNVVFSVDLTLTASDTVDGTTYTAWTSHSVGVPLLPDPWTEYGELTETEVLAWAKDALGADRVAYFETVAADLVRDQITPREVVLPLPWAPTEQPNNGA